MPQSKRNRVVDLTKTKKRPEIRTKLVSRIRECCDEYKRVFVFNVDNMRNSQLKDIRTAMRESVFFFGRNKVMQIALGRTDAEECKEGVHQVSKSLVGQCGLLFTNLKQEAVDNFFDSYRVKDFARTGNKATHTVRLPQGPLTQFPHNIEPYLRSLGMPTSLEKGVVTLLKDFEVCKKGDILTSEQARILKLLEHKQAEFRVKIKAMWTNDGSFLKLDDADDNDEQMDDDDEEEDDDLMSEED